MNGRSCANPKLKTNWANAVKKPYKLEKKAFELYYSASLHVEKPKRAIPKMVYAAIFLLFAVPAMAMSTYGPITDRLADPIQEIASNEEENINKSKQGDDMPPGSLIPAFALPSTKESLSMLSDAVDWSRVAACISSKANCICYGIRRNV